MAAHGSTWQHCIDQGRGYGMFRGGQRCATVHIGRGCPPRDKLAAYPPVIMAVS